MLHTELSGSVLAGKLQNAANDAVWKEDSVTSIPESGRHLLMSCLISYDGHRCRVTRYSLLRNAVTPFVAESDL